MDRKQYSNDWHMDESNEAGKAQVGGLSPGGPMQSPIPPMSSHDSMRKLVGGESQEDLNSNYGKLSRSTTFNVQQPLSYDENGYLGPKQSRTFLQKSLTSHRWWTFEFSALVLSVSSMIAVVALLKHYEGKPVQKFMYGLTLNGIVAALSTLTRTALMVPTATALSQSKWIWFTSDEGISGPKKLRDLEIFDSASRGSLGSFQLLWRLRGCHFAVLGALITILSFPFDTFMQQVVGTQYKTLLEVEGTAIAARSEYYNSYTHANSMASFIPDWPALNSMQSGIITQNITFPTAACSTGNCTFPIIPTLGVCGSCTDQSWNKTCDTYFICNYTMPDGTSIMVDNSIRVNMFQIGPSQGVAYNSSSETTPYIANFAAIGMPWMTQFWDDDMIIAKECALWMCVQAHNISIVNNIQTETQVMSWNTTKPVDSMNMSVPFNFTGMPAEMNIAPTSSYSVSPFARIALSISLQEMLVGSAAGGASGIEYIGNYIEAIWAWNNTDLLVANLAKSMTRNLLVSAPVALNDTSSAQYIGQAFGQNIFVSVRWEWLTLPIALVVLAVVWLLICVVQTHKSPVMAWKDSPLALLFLDADHRMKSNTIGHLEKPNGIGTAVGGANVVLQKDGGAWSFRSKS